MKTKLLLLLTLLVSTFSWGQLNIPNSTTISQNFNGMGNLATAPIPTGFRVNTTDNYTTGASSTTLSYGTTGTGAVTGTSGAGIINWANGINSSSTDRALGFLNGGALSSPRTILLEIKNTGTTNITNLSISFDYEKYRTGTRAFNWTFFHGASATAINTSEPTGDQSYGADAANAVVNPPTTINKTVNLTSLSIAPNDLYYLCWTFTGVGGSTNGQGIGIDNFNITATFAVTCAAPTVTSSAPTSVSSTGATLNGEVTNVGGGTNITERGFQYATNPSLTTPTTSNTTGTFGATSFTRTVSLSPNTLYYYRAYAVNNCATPQTGFSHTSSFPSFTTPHNAPTVATETGVSSSSFTANWSATTTPTPGSASFTYTVEVYADAGLTTIVNTYSGLTATNHIVSGLTSSTTYYYRVKIVNAGGDSAWSGVEEVTTLAPGSDIVVNSSYGYSSNIDYKLYQVATISNTSHSIGVFQFIIRDGGSIVSTDSKTTELNAISFNVTNVSNIRSAALFFGNTLINATPSIGGSTISFSGLSGTNVTALDGSTKTITLRVTFNTIVTDNQQMQFTIASATANAIGTIFDATNAGGATSSITGDRNRIEVTADRLLFVQIPTNVVVSGVMTPSPTVSACDVNGNRDLDFTTATSITSSGTLAGSPVSGTISAGLITFSGLVHTVAQTGRQLTVASSGLLFNSSLSTTFDVTDVANGTYRTLTTGTWPTTGTATWERLVAGSWTSATPAAGTTDLLIIRHAITTNGAFAATGGTKMKIENGGTFNAGHNCTFNSLTIESGGKIVITNPAVEILATTGTVTVDSGGTVTINSATFNLGDGFWKGIENFKNGSILEILNWDWDDSPTTERLIGSANIISTNTNGYYFGNIIYSGAPGTGEKAFTFVGITGTHKLCENDLIINNGSSTFSAILTNVAANVEIGGNLIVNTNKFAFGALSASNVVHLVKGNIIGNGGTIDLNQTSGASATVFVNLEGNLDIKSASQLISVDDGCKYVFSKSGIQTISNASSSGLGQRVDFEIASGSTTRLINQDFPLTNGTNNFTVLNGGILEFNYFNLTGLGVFDLNTLGTLRITSSNGVNETGATGNVLSTGTRTFSQTGIYHYVGNVTPQSTGTAMTFGSTGKRIIIDKSNPTDVVNLTQTTGTTNELYILRGIFVETEVSNIYGSGNLTMDTDGKYLTSVTSASVPRLSGLYNLNGLSTIELNANNNQVLNGGYNYRNLTFSIGGIKTITSSTPSITGTITVANSAKLNVENKTMGGTGTNLTMTGTSEYITAGTGVKPDAQGTYTLGNGTKVTFTSGSTAVPISTLQEIRLAPNYYNIDVVGNNVGTNTLTSPIKTRGTFKVKTNGLFKHSNTDGFNGSSTTAIDNTNSPTITLEDNSTIEYAGANQTITHFSPAYRNLHISGSGNKTLQVDFDTRVNENLEVLAGNTATLLIEEGKVITVKEAVKVPNSGDAKLEIKDNGQLIQIDDTNPLNLNSGENFYMERKADVTTNDYVYWSSPTDNYSVTLIPNSSLRYEWNPIKYNSNGTQGNWIAASSTMAKGKGYIVRVPPSATPSEITTNFKGTPRNGTVTVDIFRGNRLVDETNVTRFDDNWNLVGNPYPSAISALEFLQTNGANLVDTDPSTPTPTVPATTIVGAVWIWKHGIDLSSGNQDPFYYNFANNYSSTDYIKFNGTGSTDPSFNGFIGAGQGFMISMKDNPGVNPNDDDEVLPTTLSGIYKPYKNTVVFTNSMRVKDDESSYDNTQFFRTANAENSVAASDEKHRIWLDIIKTSNGQTDTALIGYVSNATMGEDNLYDTFFMPRNEVSLYSLINTKSYIIQGRSLPFDTTDLVPLGMKIISAGNHTIAIRQVDGIFEGNQNIYLEDKQLNIIHDLKQSPYHFTAPTGINNTRFVLRYTTNALGNADFDYDNQVVVFSKNNTVTINSSIQNIAEVQVYDVLGRQLYQNTAVENQEHSFAKDIAQQTIIVKVKLQNGIWVTKKVLVK